MSCAKTAEPIEGPFWFLDSGELKEQCVFWGPDRPCEGAIFRGNEMSGHARRDSAVCCTKMTEPIEVPFGLWTCMGPRKHVLHGRAH